MELADRYDVFIFDFDGTLADTLPVYFDCFRTIFTRFNLEKADETEIESWFGPNEIKLITKKFGSHEKIDQIIETFLENYRIQHSRYVQKNTEIQNYLLYLRKKKKKLAIYTGKGRDTFDYSTRALHMENLFDYVVTGDDVDYPKPNPEGILKVLAEFKVMPSNAIYFGDSDGDILTADQARIDCAVVKWFCQNKHFSLKPTYVVETFSQLYEKLNNLFDKEIP
ncbi:HAD family hydrolase [Enterococcus avium]|uniref:HAD family hydrolase n=1 Tax=Enterococcus avium TaxID=33945 RepID=UPI00378A8CB2